MHSFFHAVGFLTRLPVPRNLRPEAWKNSATWYPLVGVVIGGILAAAGYGLQQVAPPFLTGMLLVTLWVWLTGGLHLDGLMDTADGFGSYRPRERVLEIMKDSRVGGMGVLAAILLLGNKVGALMHLAEGALLPLAYALLSAPMVGRGMMMAAMYAFPYARQDGLAQELRETGRGYGWMLFLVLLTLYAALGLIVLLSLVVAVVVVALLVRSSLKKIGGLTGDVYGAICEAAETAVLVAWAVAWN